MNERMSRILAFLDETPNDAFLLYALAQEHISAGDDTAARELLEKLMNEQPGYIATYYHLGKLLERQGLKAQALDVYENGIAMAKQAGEQHALSELQSAKLELEYD
jgi:predicted Zn-dependent protease